MSTPLTPMGGLTLTREDWMRDAECRTADPNLFFPEKGKQNPEAKRICGRCSVWEECIDYSFRLNCDQGIWGGMSIKDRRAWRKAKQAELQAEEMQMQYV